jgi:hypothetical protein
VSEACQLFLVPSRSSNTPLYPSKCCELGSVPQLSPFCCLSLGLTFESFKELGVHKKCTHFFVLWCIFISFHKFNCMWVVVLLCINTYIHSLRHGIWVIWSYCCVDGNWGIHGNQSLLGGYCVQVPNLWTFITFWFIKIKKLLLHA